MTAQPVAYIRRSYSRRNDPGDRSREFQTDTVRSRARENGDADRLQVLDGDWARSGAGYGSSDRTAERTAFLGMIERVERGEVSAVYVYDLDRLARSVEWSERLANACERTGAVIYDRRYRYDPADARDRRDLRREAENNEDYSRKSTTKSRDTVAQRRKRGDKLGPPFYGKLPGESLETVVATFERIGSYHGTAEELNAIGLPSRRGHWSHSSVHRIVNRARGLTERQGKGTPRVKPRSPHVFARLLRCHCGTVLTGSLRAPDGQGRRLTVYRCLPGETTPDHGKRSVAEDIIRRWAIVEANRYVLPDAAEVGHDVAGQRAELEAQRDQVTRVAMLPGAAIAVTEDRLAEIDARLDALADQLIVEEVGPIDWENTPPAELNALLRAYWREVQLDESMQPVRVDWRIERMNAR